MRLVLCNASGEHLIQHLTLKEPDYISSMMSTYGSIFQNGRDTTRNDTPRGTAGFRAFRFKYNDVFDNHFLYRHIVDNNEYFRGDDADDEFDDGGDVEI